MYKKQKRSRTSIRSNDNYEGETIEQKVERIMNNNDEPSDGAQPIFTERKEGVLPGTNIRTDRWEVALEAQDKMNRTHEAKREENRKEAIEKYNKSRQKKEGEIKDQSTHETGSSTE